MKEYDSFYKDNDGRLRYAMTPNLFIAILLLFWALPAISFFMLIWHVLKSNAFIISKEEFHEEMVKYHKGRGNER